MKLLIVESPAKAKTISKYAVNRAKIKNRTMILKEDIESYLLEVGD